jgi:RNase adaptor protein for sRNA GlmZ degradation
LTGLDKPVIDFLEERGEITRFLQSAYKIVDAHIVDYLKRGFANLSVCFGCTGGQHRSVYSAQHTAEHIAKKFGVKVRLIHRERGINQDFNF